MFPMEKPAMLNDFVRELHGHTINAKDGTIMRLLNAETIEKIVD